MKALKIKPFKFFEGGGTEKKGGQAQVSCPPERSPEGGLRRSEKTRLIDSIGGGIL